MIDFFFCEIVTEFLYSYFQVIASIGGIFNLALGGTWGFWSFVFWSTAIFSAVILGLNVFKILPALEKSTPIISKVVRTVRQIIPYILDILTTKYDFYVAKRWNF